MSIKAQALFLRQVRHPRQPNKYTAPSRRRPPRQYATQLYSKAPLPRFVATTCDKPTPTGMRFASGAAYAATGRSK